MASDNGTAPGTAAGPNPTRVGQVVDAHQHFWDLAAHEQPFLNLPGNEPLLRNFGLADLRPLASLKDGAQFDITGRGYPADRRARQRLLEWLGTGLVERDGDNRRGVDDHRGRPLSS